MGDQENQYNENNKKAGAENGSDAKNWRDRSKKLIESGRDKLKDVSGNVQKSLNDDSNDRTYGTIAYFPVIGFLIVFLFKKKQKFAQLHAINALYIQIFFTAVWLTVWLLENLPIIEWILGLIQFKPNMTNAIMYLDIIFLLGFSIYGAVQAYSGKPFKVPYLSALFQKIRNRMGGGSSRQASDSDNNSEQV